MLGSFIGVTNASQEATFDAAEATLREMRYAISRVDRPAGGSWTIVALDSQANRITVTINPRREEATRFSVRIDPGQNESMSQTILRQIRQKLEPPELPAR